MSIHVIVSEASRILLQYSVEVSSVQRLACSGMTPGGLL